MTRAASLFLSQTAALGDEKKRLQWKLLTLKWIFLRQNDLFRELKLLSANYLALRLRRAAVFVQKQRSATETRITTDFGNLSKLFKLKPMEKKKSAMFKV